MAGLASFLFGARNGHSTLLPCLVYDPLLVSETLRLHVKDYCMVLSAACSSCKLVHRFDRLSWDGSFSLRVSQANLEVLASGVSVVEFWGDPGLVVTISGSPTVSVEVGVGSVEFLDDFRPGSLKCRLACAWSAGSRKSNSRQ